MPQRSVAHPMVTRQASIAPGTINEADHTVEVVFTTGAQVRRFDWMDALMGGAGDYVEELEVSEQALDLSRLNAGAAFLNTHMQYSAEHIAGAVDKAWITGTEGRALIRVDVGCPLGAEMWRQIKGRFLNFVSVGYLVERYQEFIRDGMRVMRAVRWTPVEISGVPVPADAGAGFRSAELRTHCTVEPADNKGKRTMPKTQRELDEEKRRRRAARAEADNEPDGDEERAEDDAEDGEDDAEMARNIKAAEKRAAANAVSRQNEILDLCTLSGRTLKQAQELIASGRSVADIRKELVNERADNSGGEVRGTQPGGAGAGADYKPGGLRARMEQTLQARGVEPAKPIQQGV